MVACEARRQHLKIPLVAISMGSLGAISRIAGGLFGSDITFASGIKASAPGQLPLDDLKKAWKALPRHF
jgi:3-dehydroquinate dehydratase-1